MANLSDLYYKYEKVKPATQTSPVESSASANLASPEELDTLAERLKKKKKQEEEALARSIPEDQKQAEVTPAPGPGGKTTPVVSTLVEDKPKTASSQDDVERTLKEVGALQAKLGANKVPDRGQLTNLIKELDTLKPDTPASSPETQKFVQARADAYRAYKEKADRNDWLEIAQNLVNSITQFASAQAAMGTRFAGGNIPLTGIDYGARTARAGREYEMATGEISAQEKAALAEQERADRLRREELAGKRGTKLEEIRAKEAEIRAGEERAERIRGEAVSIYKIISEGRQQEKQLNNSLLIKTQELKQKGIQQAGKMLDDHIDLLEKQQKTLAEKIQSANTLSTADKKEYDKALTVFATNLGVPSQELVKKADVESGIGKLDKTYMKEDIAGGKAKEWSQQYQDVTKQLNDLRAMKMGSQTAPVAPATPSTTPSASDTVEMVDPSGRLLRVPASDVARLEAFGAKRK